MMAWIQLDTFLSCVDFWVKVAWHNLEFESELRKDGLARTFNTWSICIAQCSATWHSLCIKLECAWQGYISGDVGTDPHRLFPVENLCKNIMFGHSILLICHLLLVEILTEHCINDLQFGIILSARQIELDAYLLMDRVGKTFGRIKIDCYGVASSGLHLTNWLHVVIARRVALVVWINI